MKLTENMAEILGMFAADGCLQNEYICMWGNINEDRFYYNKIICPLFSKIFKKNITAHEKRSNSVYGFYLCSKKIVKLFREIGFSNNKTYNVEVPKIILKSNNLNLYSAFIRGFVDCDGCIVFQKRTNKYNQFKRTFHTYPKIEVKTVSENMAKDIDYMLNKLGINHTLHVSKNNKLNEKQVYKLVIRGPLRVELYINKIGFNNYAQFSKYLVWKKYGFCPVRTTSRDRRSILNEELSPYAFYNNGPGRI